MVEVVAAAVVAPAVAMLLLEAAGVKAAEVNAPDEAKQLELRLESSACSTLTSTRSDATSIGAWSLLVSPCIEV